MKSILLLVYLSALLIVVPTMASLSQVDHKPFTDVLTSHVHDGRVDYASLRKDGRFIPYVNSLSRIKASTLTGNERLAFWINVYNANTLKMVCDNFPLRSIRDLAQGKVWDAPFISIEGTAYSLNDIENDVLRPLGDSRIHFALVCAARSCPPLRSEAYEADRLDKQLYDQGRLFLSTPMLNAFDITTRKAKLSHVFEWYLADFGRNKEQLIRNISMHAPDAVRVDLHDHAKQWTIEYLDYDWSLNGK
ncbi:MAG: DUF547 domain-containing protein [Candidatus Kapabacteria bacterium]|nr:DUF547 domain-containing protein [Candidatus Kapabacteria bacterium]